MFKEKQTNDLFYITLTFSNHLAKSVDVLIDWCKLSLNLCTILRNIFINLSQSYIKALTKMKNVMSTDVLICRNLPYWNTYISFQIKYPFFNVVRALESWSYNLAQLWNFHDLQIILLSSSDEFSCKQLKTHFQGDKIFHASICSV